MVWPVVLTLRAVMIAVISFPVIRSFNTCVSFLAFGLTKTIAFLLVLNTDSIANQLRPLPVVQN